MVTLIDDVPKPPGLLAAKKKIQSNGRVPLRELNGTSTTTPKEKKEGRVRWVRGEDDGKAIARLIVGASARSAVVGFPVVLHAKYEGNVNTAIKGLAIATKRLTVACVPTFRENRTELTFTVVQVRGDPPPTRDLLSVARATDYRILAGAIAKRARLRTPVILRAIGPAAVFAAVRAAATAREYLDREPIDLLAFPRFEKIHVDGRIDDTTVIDLGLVPISRD